MKTAFFKLEIALTILCVGLIFALVTTMNKNREAQIVPENAAAYGIVKGMQDPNALRAKAQIEADKMIQSGDVSQYQKALEETGLLEDENILTNPPAGLTPAP